MTKRINYYADIITWNDIESRMASLDMKPNKNTDDIKELEGIKAINKQISLTVLDRMDYEDIVLVSARKLPLVMLEDILGIEISCELLDIFDVSIRNIDQYLVDNDLVKIDVFDREYYF